MCGSLTIFEYFFLLWRTFAVGEENKSNVYDVRLAWGGVCYFYVCLIFKREVGCERVKVETGDMEMLEEEGVPYFLY